jgi:hypothetical protein
MTFRSEPSGFAERTRPALTSRKNKRPTVDLLLLDRVCALGACVVFMVFITYRMFFNILQPFIETEFDGVTNQSADRRDRLKIAFVDTFDPVQKNHMIPVCLLFKI